MMLSDNDLDSFIKAYRVDTGETLPRDEAFRAAHRVLAFFGLLAQVPGIEVILQEYEEISVDPSAHQPTGIFPASIQHHH